MAGTRRFEVGCGTVAGVSWIAFAADDSLVGWVEAIRIDAGAEDDGFRFALPILRIDAHSRSRGASRPRFASSFALFETEGAGKTGCLLHPRSRVRFAQTKMHTSIQGSGSIPAFPAQWLYGLLRALPGERLFCLRRRRDTALDPIGSMRNRQLSASTAAPEPHDFAVRFRRVRLARHLRPPHLTARS